MTTSTTPVADDKVLIWSGYDDALRGLSCKDLSGNILEPEMALVKFKDGWRLFANFHGLSEGVKTTAWPIDPQQVLLENP